MFIITLWVWTIQNAIKVMTFNAPKTSAELLVDCVNATDFIVFSLSIYREMKFVKKKEHFGIGPLLILILYFEFSRSIFRKRLNKINISICKTSL